MIRRAFHEVLTTIAVTLVAAVGHHIRLNAEELQFGVECGDALVAWVVQSACLVVDENKTKQLRVSVKHVLRARYVIEIFLLIGAE